MISTKRKWKVGLIIVNIIMLILETILSIVYREWHTGFFTGYFLILTIWSMDDFKKRYKKSFLTFVLQKGYNSSFTKLKLS